MQSIQPKSTSLTTKLVLFPFFIFPRFLQRLLAYLLALFWFYCLKLRKDLALKHVQKSLPESSEKERKKIVFQSFYNLILILFEYSYFPFSPWRVKKHTVIKNLKNYENALQENKGVILLAGHMGNGEISLFRTCMEGFPLHLIAKRVGVKFIDRGLFEAREASGLMHISPKNTGDQITEILKNNGSIVFVQDQFTHPPKGVASKFLDQPTYTNASLAHFALKTNAVVIPVNVYRGKGDKTIIEFCERIKTQLPYNDHSQNINFMTQNYNDWLGARIKEHPGDWMWLHKRWKRCPPEKSI